LIAVSGILFNVGKWNGEKSMPRTEIWIPSSIEKLHSRCFYGCESLSTITFESVSKLSCIENNAFANCSSLSTICIPCCVAKICESCFTGRKSLSTITFESVSKLSYIEKNAFFWCSSLSTIYIPCCVEKLGEFCFNGCKSLSTITFESGSKLLQIDMDSFRGCSSLSSIYLSSADQTIRGRDQFPQMKIKFWANSSERVESVKIERETGAGARDGRETTE
jgi:hypothetical protein